jgi:hypothetical protein
MNTNDEAEVMSEEQAAALRSLEEKAGIEQPIQAVAGQQDQAPEMAPADALAGLLQVASVVADGFGFKSVASVWHEGACRGVADRAVPVLLKYAWGRRVLDVLQTGAGIEELALVVYLAPVAMATIKAARLDAEAIRAKSKPADVAGKVEDQGAGGENG